MAEETQMEKKRKLEDSVVKSKNKNRTSQKRNAPMKTCQKETAPTDQTVYNMISEIVGQDPATRKLFVRGLPYSATNEVLQSLFSSHGEIEDATVVMDKIKGTCKGYGFVTFKSIDGAHNALEMPTRKYEGRDVHCNLAAAGAHGSHTTTTAAQPAAPVDENDVSFRKLFARGLAYETTNESFVNLFAQFGEIEEGIMTMDKLTGKPRGYGFITFKNRADCDKALQTPGQQLPLDGRTIHFNLASQDPKNAAGGGMMGAGANDVSLRKVFVRGLNYETTQEAFTQLFAQYGEIEEGNIATDKMTGKSRGYGFVTYATAAAASTCLQIPQKQLDGRTVHCNLAEQGKQNRPQNAMEQQQQQQMGYYQQPMQQQWGAPQQAYAAYQQPVQQAAYGAYGQQQRWPQQQQAQGMPVQAQQWQQQAAQPTYPGYPQQR